MRISTIIKIGSLLIENLKKVKTILKPTSKKAFRKIPKALSLLVGVAELPPMLFVSLSNFVPARNDPIEGTWQTIVKYGKLGEEYATGGNPFKRPLLMFTAGSTFYDAPCREYYGRVVKDIAPSYHKVVQYALALPVPIKLP